MKLRISGNSWRLRLTRKELAELIKVEKLENGIQLGPGADQVLIYRLELCAVRKSPALNFEAGRIVMFLPEVQARRWAESDQVGIYTEESWGLKLVLEKDFKCLEQRPGEDDSDAFDRPIGAESATCGSGDV
jgi:hypothetical protein